MIDAAATPVLARCQRPARCLTAVFARPLWALVVLTLGVTAVRVADTGNELRALAGRVTVMDGHMRVESLPDGGRRIIVDLPTAVDLTGTSGGEP